MNYKPAYNVYWPAERGQNVLNTLFTGITQLPQKSLNIFFSVCFFLSGYPAVSNILYVKYYLENI